MRDIDLATQSHQNWTLVSKEDKSAILLFCRDLQESKMRMFKKKKKKKKGIKNKKLTEWQKK